MMLWRHWATRSVEIKGALSAHRRCSPWSCRIRTTICQDEEDEPEIAKRKTFYVKVMTVEEAILQMEMLGHTFFMYRDGDTGEIDVVYKRRDGKYGVLEPEG